LYYEEGSYLQAGTSAIAAFPLIGAAASLGVSEAESVGDGLLQAGTEEAATVDNAIAESTINEADAEMANSALEAPQEVAAGTAAAESLANSAASKWAFVGTPEERAFALSYGAELLKNFEADGGTFAREISSANWWGKYTPFASGDAPVITLNAGASEGTLLEELVHHMQVSDLSPAQIEAIFDDPAAVEAIESQAKEILTALGYARVPA